MEKHELYMSRCLELAKLGAGHVAPNPMVGAVLVYEDHIIGEGYHRQYGMPHAEVNCINSVKEEDRQLIKKAVLYVSLEPCAHFGKTPPCADLIIQNKIPIVVIGCRDPFDQVDGKGIEKLEKAGILVITGILEEKCKKLNKRFFTFHTNHRPYIILKWAQSSNQKIAHADYSRVLISHIYTNRLVHKWRSEEAAIMVGTNTALHDNPILNTRNWTGSKPVRLITDLNLRLPQTLNIFDRQQKTVIFNAIKHEDHEQVLYYKIGKYFSFTEELLKACYELQLQSILIEGGSTLIESFIKENVWDEARIITNAQLVIDNGLPAPQLTNHQFICSQTLASDSVSYYNNNR